MIDDIEKELDGVNTFNKTQEVEKHLITTCDDEHCQHHHFSPEDAMTHVRSSPKMGRNNPCSCGSGKKYKKCCLT